MIAMTHKILVPTDFSPVACDAENYAAQLAKQLHSSVHLLHVFTEYSPVLSIPETWAISLNQLKNKIDEQINLEVKRLSDTYGIAVSSEIREGFPGDIIAKAAEDIDADFIIAGIDNPGSGSAIFSIIRQTNVPLIVIPRNYTYKPIRNIVLAVDLKEMSGHSLFSPLYSLYKNFDASLEVLHVHTPGMPEKPSEISGKIALSLSLASFSFEYNTIESENIDYSILDFVESHPADLLVMVARPHNILERIFGALHTTTIGENMFLPLLVLKD